MDYLATAYGLRTGQWIDALRLVASSDDDAIRQARDWHHNTLGDGYRVELDRVDHQPVADIHP